MKVIEPRDKTTKMINWGSFLKGNFTLYLARRKNVSWWFGACCGGIFPGGVVLWWLSRVVRPLATPPPQEIAGLIKGLLTLVSLNKAEN